MGTIDDYDSTVTLSLDNGDCECGIITDFEFEDNSYIAVTPLDGQDIDSNQIFLYKFFADGNDYAIENIESNDLYAKVAEEFNRVMDEYDNSDEIIPD